MIRSLGLELLPTLLLILIVMNLVQIHTGQTGAPS